MRKALIIFLLLSCAVPWASGQRWEHIQTKPRHRIQVGAGFMPYTAGQEFFFEFNRGCDDYWENYYYRGDIRSQYTSLPLNYGPLRTTGALSLEYGYRVNRWLDVGLGIGYVGFYRKITDRRDNSSVGRHNVHYTQAFSNVRFMWARNDVVNFYSGLGLGFSYKKEDDYQWREKGRYLTFNVILVGLTVGHGRLYGFGELGAGVNGVMHGGIGYRF